MKRKTKTKIAKLKLNLKMLNVAYNLPISTKILDARITENEIELVIEDENLPDVEGGMALVKCGRNYKYELVEE